MSQRVHYVCRWSRITRISRETNSTQTGNTRSCLLGEQVPFPANCVRGAGLRLPYYELVHCRSARNCKGSNAITLMYLQHVCSANHSLYILFIISRVISVFISHSPVHTNICISNQIK